MYIDEDYPFPYWPTCSRPIKSPGPRKRRKNKGSKAPNEESLTLYFLSPFSLSIRFLSPNCLTAHSLCKSRKKEREREGAQKPLQFRNSDFKWNAKSSAVCPTEISTGVRVFQFFLRYKIHTFLVLSQALISRSVNGLARYIAIIRCHQRRRFSGRRRRPLRCRLSSQGRCAALSVSEVLRVPRCLESAPAEERGWSQGIFLFIHFSLFLLVCVDIAWIFCWLFWGSSVERVLISVFH